MKETDAIHGLAMRLEDVPLRHMQVRQTREILEVNEKIKALVTLRKIEQYSKISQYIRKKNEDGRVKRTVYLRNKFMDGTGSLSSRRTSDHSILSIDTCNNLKMLYEKKGHGMSQNRAKYIEALIAFQEDFKNGLMEQEYDTLLERYLLKVKDQCGGEQLSELVREASKAIKDKLFKAYLKRKGYARSPKNSLLLRNKSNQSIGSAAGNNPDHAAHNRSNGQHRSAHMSPESNRQQKHQISFIYKQRSKFSQRRLGSINKMYSGQVDTIDLATKVGTKTRRLNELIFLKRLKEHRNTTYRSIAQPGQQLL